MKKNTLYCQDCIQGMKELEPNSIDAIVTDAPYGLEFMGKEWDTFKEIGNSKTMATTQFTTDSGKPRFNLPLPRHISNSKDYQQFSQEWATEALRVLKPGGHLLSFGGTRTYHRMVCGIEDAGFEIRDCIMWIFGSGFPKSLNIGKAIDKQSGAEREVLGIDKVRGNTASFMGKSDVNSPIYDGTTLGVGTTYTTKPSTPEAKQWDGWYTGLKPAVEPIVVARKPFKGTVVDNLLKYGTGGLNIDGCRIEFKDELPNKRMQKDTHKKVGEDSSIYMLSKAKNKYHRIDWIPETLACRYPSNVILDEVSAGMLGIASRFFYVAKASREERNIGCKNNHPTIKPLRLMEYLVKLVCPEGGLVLDPFAGSGTTLMACKRACCDYIGFEKEKDYCDIAKARIKATVSLHRWI